MDIMIAQLSDIPQITKLYVQNWQSTYRGLLPDHFLDSLTVESAVQKWTDYLRSDGHTLLTAHDGQLFCGFAACKPDNELSDCIYLDSLHVAKTARGKGVGTRLIREIGQLAHAKGYRKMSICIVKGNDNARNLYTKLGAVHYKDFTDDFHGTPSNSEKLLWESLPF